MNFLLRFLSKEIKKIESKIKRSFDKVKEELDEHRESINANTEEIQFNYEYIIRLENKIDELEERIEKIYLMISAISEKLNLGFLTEKKRFKENIWLTHREKIVFKALMQLCEESGPITIFDLINETGLSESMIKEILLEISKKGVPVIIREVNYTTYYELDPDFIQQQKEREIVKM